MDKQIEQNADIRTTPRWFQRVVIRLNVAVEKEWDRDRCTDLATICLAVPLLIAAVGALLITQAG